MHAARIFVWFGDAANDFQRGIFDVWFGWVLSLVLGQCKYISLPLVGLRPDSLLLTFPFCLLLLAARSSLLDSPFYSSLRAPRSLLLPPSSILPSPSSLLPLPCIPSFSFLPPSYLLLDFSLFCPPASLLPPCSSLLAPPSSLMLSSVRMLQGLGCLIGRKSLLGTNKH